MHKFSMTMLIALASACSAGSPGVSSSSTSSSSSSSSSSGGSSTSAPASSTSSSSGGTGSSSWHVPSSQDGSSSQDAPASGNASSLEAPSSMPGGGSSSGPYEEPNPANCSAAPSNHRAAAASSLMAWEQQYATLCPPFDAERHSTWLMTPFTAGGGTNTWELTVEFKRGERAGNYDFTIGLFDLATEEFVGTPGHCTAGAGTSDVCRVTTMHNAPLYIRAFAADGSVLEGEEVTLKLRWVSGFDGADCTEAPANTSPAAAALLPLDQALQDRICMPAPGSDGAWWTTDFTTGDGQSTWQLKATFNRWSQAHDFNFTVGHLDVASGQFKGTPGQCTATPHSIHDICTVRVEGNEPLFIRGFAANEHTTLGENVLLELTRIPDEE